MSDFCILDILLPEWKGPLFVSAQAIAVDGSGAGHSVQVVWAVGESGHPLAVPLCFLLPSESEDRQNINQTACLQSHRFFSLLCVHAI